MAEICTSLGYYCLQEVMGTLAAEREPLNKSPANERPARARALRKIPEHKAPPVETEAQPAFFRGVHVYAALQGIDALSRIGVFYDRARRRPICFQHPSTRGTELRSQTQRSWNLISIKPLGRRRPHRINAQRSKRRRHRRGARSVRLSLTRRSLPCATRDTSSRTRLQEFGKSLAVWGRRLHTWLLYWSCPWRKTWSLHRASKTLGARHGAQHAFCAHIVRERGNLESKESEFVRLNAECLRQCVRGGRREISEGSRVSER